MDSDNGSEFINWHLKAWCESKGIQLTRGRPYKKDDNAHVEQKNWTHVRKLIGYDRYDTQAAVDAMNDLYRNEWRLFCNLYLPSVKLAQKIRVGSKIKRIYSKAQTPLDRLLDSDKGDRAKLEALRKLRETLNPFELSAAVNKKLGFIWTLASKANLRLAEKPKASRRAKFWEQRQEYAMPNLFIPMNNIALDRIRMDWARERRLNVN